MQFEIEKYIRNIPDFPKPGIQFKDITPLLQNPYGFAQMIDWYIHVIRQVKTPDVIVGIESRGFIMGAAIAHRLQIGFVPVRKPGKLPAATYSQSYELEYGTDTLQIHQDAVVPGQKVAVVDDLLATGGTADAAIKLVRQAGGDVVSCNFLIELTGLNGRKKLDHDGSAVNSFLKI